MYVHIRAGLGHTPHTQPHLHLFLQAFDEHMNLILSNVNETVTTTTKDPATGEERVQQAGRHLNMLFVRGDGVVLVSPPPRTA